MADIVDVVLEKEREPLRECRRTRHGGILRRESREKRRTEVVHVGTHDADARNARAVLRAACRMVLRAVPPAAAAPCKVLHLEHLLVFTRRVVAEPEVRGGQIARVCCVLRIDALDLV